MSSCAVSISPLNLFPGCGKEECPETTKMKWLVVVRLLNRLYDIVGLQRRQKDLKKQGDELWKYHTDP